MPTILALLLLASSAVATELLVENAVIYTLDPERPRASAMLVLDGRIAALDAEAVRRATAGARRIDAKGRPVYPGFIDAHGHVAGLGDSLEILDLRGMKSLNDIAEAVRERAAKAPAGTWIRGRGWDQTNWGGAFPPHDILSAAAPEHPVYLSRVDGHAAWVNRKALELAGVSAKTPDPKGGKIIRNEKGEPAGVLVDRAEALVESKIPEPTAEQLRTRISRAAGECVRLGLTTVHDAGIGREELKAYRSLIAERELPIRVYAMIGGRGELWREYLQSGPEIGDRLTVRSIKLMSDGAMGSRGAAMWQPYADDKENTGLLLLTEDEIRQVARDASRAGFQVNTHAIGDRANRTVLDAYAAVLQGPNDRRFRIEHAQVVAPQDFAVFARYSIIASVQATHATSDMRWAEARLGPDRLTGAWAWQRFLQSGARIANGSDFPVESADPIAGFYAAVTRQDRTGKPAGGFLPDQRLTREQALRSWTLDGAYAAFEEKDKGSLQPGKLADFVMLSRDIMQVPEREILDAQVVLTVVGGKIEHEEKK